MKLEERVVVFPIRELWTTRAIVGAEEIRALSADAITSLLHATKVNFAVADAGLPLKWIPAEECFSFWKTEVKQRLVDPARADTGFRLKGFPDEYCYLASEWKSDGDEPIILLRKFH